MSLDRLYQINAIDSEIFNQNYALPFNSPTMNPKNVMQLKSGFKIRNKGKIVSAGY
jgi:hypothetical protein